MPNFKYIFHLSLCIIGSHVQEEVDVRECIEEDVWLAMAEAERDFALSEMFDEWREQQIYDQGWYISE